MTEQHEAWSPSLREFADLVCRAADGEFNSARHGFSQWSFWRTGFQHACLCDRTGRFYINAVSTPANIYWASKDDVLAVLGIP